jgi:transposase-like protein
MRERFGAEDFQAVIDLYLSGATSSQVAQRFGISVSSVKRVLRDHGIRKYKQQPHGHDQTRNENPDAKLRSTSSWATRPTFPASSTRLTRMG